MNQLWKKGQQWGVPFLLLLLTSTWRVLKNKWYITSSPLKPTCRIWKHYIDDTYLVVHDSVESFLQHLNHKQPSICFIMETENYNKLTLLNTTGTREPGGCLTSSVYRKPTHAYQYSAYDSNH